MARRTVQNLNDLPNAFRGTIRQITALTTTMVFPSAELGQYWLGKALPIALRGLFPEIRQIYFDYTEYPGYHDFVSYLRHIVQVQKLPRLQYISPPHLTPGIRRDRNRGTTCYDLHYQCCFKFRRTITRMNLDRFIWIENLNPA